MRSSGLVSSVCHLPLLSAYLTVISESCTAHTGDALNIIGECRSQEFTEVLVYAADTSMLWDQYGIVGDMAVSSLSISLYHVVDHTHFWTLVPWHPSESFKPFTSEFPWADIYEVITPDILHQVIKGTFKDHLVTWVEEYLVLVHGKTHAATVLDDIDCR
jgi:hypothetical protein